MPLAGWVVLGGLLLWAVLVAASALAGNRWPEAARFIPDVLRLLRRLATDPLVPRSARLRIWAVAAYLASPIDLVPDLVPGLGYGDDVLVAAWALRSVIRRAGVGAVQRNWSGSDAGLERVLRLGGVPPATSGTNPT